MESLDVRTCNIFLYLYPNRHFCTFQFLSSTFPWYLLQCGPLPSSTAHYILNTYVIIKGPLQRTVCLLILNRKIKLYLNQIFFFLFHQSHHYCIISFLKKKHKAFFLIHFSLSVVTLNSYLPYQNLNTVRNESPNIFLKVHGHSQISLE